ncbi:MAG TPA: hypothetical protein VK457_15435 [Chloroflexota bacterium]|nr:hypothetical protein [Chloroflexota bacterium]
MRHAVLQQLPVQRLGPILRFIEWRWDLQPLGERDAKANNLLNAFDFSYRP